MATKKNPLKRIRLVYQRTTPLVKVLVISTLVVCTITLVALSIGIANSKAQLEQDRKKAAALEQENAVLTEDIGDLGTIKSIKDLARRFLGLFDPDTIIFSPEE